MTVYVKWKSRWYGPEGTTAVADVPDCVTEAMDNSPGSRVIEDLQHKIEALAKLVGRALEGRSQADLERICEIEISKMREVSTEEEIDIKYKRKEL